MTNKKIWYSLIFTMFVSGCSTISPVKTGKIQPLEGDFSRLLLPLEADKKATWIVRSIDTSNDEVFIEQHAFKGGRVTAIFDSRKVGAEYGTKQKDFKEIFNRISESQFVRSYLGSNVTVGEIKQHKKSVVMNLNTWLDNKNGGLMQYSIIKNQTNTRYCFAFSIQYAQANDNTMSLDPAETILFTLLQKIQFTIIDGVLCDSASNTNVVELEQAGKKFISYINLR